MKVPVPAVRYRLVSSGEGMHVEIPRRWSWRTFLLMPPLIALFLWPVKFVGRVLFKLFLEPVHIFSLFPLLFLTVWLAVWLYGISGWVWAWLWNLGGREVLRCNGTSFELQREVLGYRRTKIFPVRELLNFRYVPAVHQNRTRLEAGLGFDFRGKTIRLGAGMEEAEVKLLITDIYGCWRDLAPTAKSKEVNE